jgi:quinol monooxygenase YgiN
VIIVAGFLIVDPGARAAYLDGCDEVVRLARSSPGCVDFHLSADPLDPERINVFEQWESPAAVEAFRGSGPSSEQQAMIRDAQVFQHEVASTLRL